VERLESLTDASRLAESWRVHLEAANLSRNTINLYLSGSETSEVSSPSRIRTADDNQI
jgi:hypothetical protein